MLFVSSRAFSLSTPTFLLSTPVENSEATWKKATKCNKKTSNIISKFNDDFSEDFFEVLHISVGQKIKILENRPDFLTFSAKTHIRL